MRSLINSQLLIPAIDELTTRTLMTGAGMNLFHCSFYTDVG